MQIFDEIKVRGVEDVAFISMDGVSGLEEGEKAIFPQVVVQRCIVHLIRHQVHSLQGLQRIYTAQLKKVLWCRQPQGSYCRVWPIQGSLETLPRSCGRMGAKLDAWWSSFFTMAVLYVA